MKSNQEKPVLAFNGGVAEGMMPNTSVGVDAAKFREALLGGYCQSRLDHSALLLAYEKANPPIRR